MTNVIMYSIYFFLKYSIYFKNKKKKKNILSHNSEFFPAIPRKKKSELYFLIYFFPYILFEVCLNSHKSGFFL